MDSSSISHGARTMTQNIYDNPEFFAGYSRLDRSVEGLAGAAEWPALRALLPDLRGTKVVDLGCGFGWFCRFARAQGATRVLSPAARGTFPPSLCWFARGPALGINSFMTLLNQFRLLGVSPPRPSSFH